MRSSGRWTISGIEIKMIDVSIVASITPVVVLARTTHLKRSVALVAPSAETGAAYFTPNTEPLLCKPRLAL